MPEEPAIDDRIGDEPAETPPIFSATTDDRAEPTEFLIPAAMPDVSGGIEVLVVNVEPQVADDGVALRSLLALGTRLERGLGELQTRFDREIRAETTREKVVDRLHAELQEYKQDLLLNTMRPVFIDLIQLHDDLGKVPLAMEEEGDRLGTVLAGFQQGIEDVLYRQGVEPFQADGDAFDPKRQRAVATVATDDPAANKTVAARLRKGFRAGDRVIRPEIVSVYSIKK